MSRYQNLKYLTIYNELQKQIQEGYFSDGDKLPTETHLAEEYGVSRPTVTRALNALKDDGLIYRITGSGSFVTPKIDNMGLSLSRLVGLIIPNLGKGSVFEAICARIAELSGQANFSLIWGGSFPISPDKDEHQNVIQLAHKYVGHKVSAVFFTPLEQKEGFEDINIKVIEILQNAGISVILLDSDYLDFPERSSHDLVSLDHYQAGYQMTDLLIKQKIRRIDFVNRPMSASSILLRKHGYRSALLDSGIIPSDEWLHEFQPENEDFVSSLINNSKARNFICGNDQTAAAFLNTCTHLNIPVPGKVRICGFDDAQYSEMLKTSLTTFRQPTDLIAEEAVRILLSRIKNPEMDARTIRLSGTPVIRDSSYCKQ